MNYENRFKRTLLKEDDRGAVNMSPDPGSYGEDEDAWRRGNPDIVDNDDMNSKFDVEGLDGNEIEKYSDVIEKWGEGLQVAISQLAQIIKFASAETLSDAPGSGQFSELIKLAPSLKRDLSGFKSQVDDLADTVKLAINDANKERSAKINSI